MSWLSSRAFSQRRTRGLFATGLFMLVTSPILMFGSRVAGSVLGTLYGLLSLLFLVVGFVLVFGMFVVGSKNGQLPNFAGYVSMCAVVVSAGGFVLAWASDPAVFVSTLVGALVGVIVTKMELLTSKAPRAEEFTRPKEAPKSRKRTIAPASRPRKARRPPQP